MKHTLKTFVLLLVLTSINFAQTEWAFDKSHSNVSFSVVHMLISETEGTFKTFDGKVITEGDSFENAQISLTVDLNSVDTDNEKRDNHLKSDDFFNTEKFPEMIFKGKKFTKVDDKNYELLGDLTIRDVTKEVKLDVVLNGFITDPWGNNRAGFKLTGELNRFDYGLKWNKVMEAGGFIVSETVTINANIELIQQSKVSQN
jgi:polyisoprenoid-binding protein YceI